MARLDDSARQHGRAGSIALVVGILGALGTSARAETITDSHLDADGRTGFSDLVAVLAAWGNAGGPEDLDGSGVVDFGDAIVIIATWGRCP